MAVVSRVCIKASGGAGFGRLVARGLPDMDRVHYYVALAPVAGCLIRMLDPKLSPEVGANYYELFLTINMDNVVYPNKDPGTINQ